MEEGAAERQAKVRALMDELQELGKILKEKEAKLARMRGGLKQAQTKMQVVKLFSMSEDEAAAAIQARVRGASARKELAHKSSSAGPAASLQQPDMTKAATTPARTPAGALAMGRSRVDFDGTSPRSSPPKTLRAMTALRATTAIVATVPPGEQRMHERNLMAYWEEQARIVARQRREKAQQQQQAQQQSLLDAQLAVKRAMGAWGAPTGPFRPPPASVLPNPAAVDQPIRVEAFREPPAAAPARRAPARQAPAPAAPAPAPAPGLSEVVRRALYPSPVDDGAM